ncbi:DUF4906 domain-containing protein [Prevotella sp. 10(H)]|uniref:DUF4906 domain-containing protein n=1 Tax=Prevotella sp. 10(H) TaxID=1158294 RepID=UPI0004A77D30|nr:DUF4906 domain-containing protein [Prevotella sp. 10(H)]
MINRYNIIIALLMLLMTSFMTSCSESDDSIPEEPTKDAKLLLSIRAKAAVDDLSKNGDSKFTSLLIYIFNKADGTREYSGSVIAIASDPLEEYSISVNVSPQTKIIYAVANTTNTDNSLSERLGANVTMEQLEALTVTSQNFPDNGIMMIGKKEVVMDSEFVTAEVPMERLAARLDIYLFKNQDLQTSQVRVVSAQLVNQIKNSNVSYKNNAMVSPINKATVTGVINQSTTLTTMPSDMSGIVPENAHTSFYTYQNIAGASAPDDDTPYLRLVINIDGTDFTYRGYFTDDGQTANKYSLMRNTVYTVIAMLTHPDNLLILKIIPMPWTVNESQTGGSVTDADFSLDPWTGDPQGAQTGVIHYPTVVNGNALDETSYATYSFKLTAPLGKRWTATLTNGYDFTFGTEGSSIGIIPVSQGISGDTEYQIRVGARKYWDGIEKTTNMYITVDGQKLNINPVQPGGTRKYPGNSDTEITLVQTGYEQ